MKTEKSSSVFGKWLTSTLIGIAAAILILGITIYFVTPNFYPSLDFDLLAGTGLTKFAYILLSILIVSALSFLISLLLGEANKFEGETGEKKNTTNSANLPPKCNIKQDQLTAIYQQIHIRLKREVSQQLKSANVNLVVGFAFALAGVLILLPTAVNDHQNVTDFIIYYIPRISLVVIFEVLSFFFLRLYRKGLENSKYFQNELTNFQFRFSAIAMVKESNDKNYTTAIDNFLKTERNFVLEKGQSTVQLENEKIEEQRLANIGNFMSNIFANVKK